PILRNGNQRRREEILARRQMRDKFPVYIRGLRSLANQWRIGHTAVYRPALARSHTIVENAPNTVGTKLGCAQVPGVGVIDWQILAVKPFRKLSKPRQEKKKHQNPNGNFFHNNETDVVGNPSMQNKMSFKFNKIYDNMIKLLFFN